MKQVITLSFVMAWAAVSILWAQTPMVSPTAGPMDMDSKVTALRHEQGPELTTMTHTPRRPRVFTGSLEPFFHGVASGDPLQDGVIIWTRITPSNIADYIQTGDSIMVIWRMGYDVNFRRQIRQDTVYTDASKDFTVKVDVRGLEADRTYYYEFEALNKRSLRGRTKTAPKRKNRDHVRFAVVSCSNYEAGYFNAYARIGEYNDLDAVIHLGDYIYEYPANVYGDTNLVDRRHDTVETVMLNEYRARYSQYRLDPNLRRCHQQHPFINVWDDHESANDAYKDGAENHDPVTEGTWEARKRAARQAFFEWIPIRPNADSSIYRALKFGTAVDLFMVDTRIEERDEQILDVTNPALYAPTRTMLGTTQRDWLFNNLSNSTALWKIVGNQVIFAQFNIGWFAALDPTFSPAALESIFLDIWDGYPAERLAIINYIEQNNLDDVIILTGDFHSAFAFDVADTVVNDLAGYTPVSNYDPATGAGAVAIEFATPSVTSANFDENLDPATSAFVEGAINNGIPGLLNNPNPHMKYADLDRHGYYLLDVDGCRAQCDFYFVDRIDTPTTVQNFGAGLKANCGDNHLTVASGPVISRKRQKVSAPMAPRKIDGSNPYVNNAVSPNPGTGPVGGLSTNAVVLSLFPNPSTDQLNAQYALENPAAVTFSIVDMQGREVARAVRGQQNEGVYALQLDVSSIPAGMYVLRLQADEEIVNQRVVIE